MTESRQNARDKLVFVAFDLPDQSSHFFNELLGYKLAARELQFQPIILLPCGVDRRLAAALDAEAVLEPIPNLGTTDPSSFETQVDAFLHLRLDQLWATLEAEELPRIRAVVFPQGHPAVIRAVGLWLKDVTAEQRPSVFFRFTGKFADAALANGCPAASFYRLAACDLSTREGQERVFFLVNSDTLLRALSRTGCRRCFLLPTPKYLDAPAGPLRPALDEVTVYLHFNVRSGSLAAAAAEIIRLVRDRHPRAKFLAKFTLDCVKGGEPSAILSGLADFVRLVPSEQDTDEYFQNFAECDLVVLPYRPEPYTMQTSGVFVEAVSFGKPVVAPSGTLMAKEIASGHGVGTLFTEPTAQAIATGISEAIRTLRPLHEAAGSLAARMREQSSCRTVLEQMLALSDTALDMEVRYHSGEDVDFSDPYDSRCFLRAGWSHSEDWGVWSVGPRAELEFKLEGEWKEAPVLIATVVPFLAPGHDRLAVQVLANGAVAGEWSFALDDPNGIRPCECMVQLPDLQAQAKLHITFAIDTPASPLELGLSADKRSLGLGLARLVIMPSANGQRVSK